MARDKVILAYSGGLDTSVMVPWIGEKYNLDVVAFTVDLGQGEDIHKIRQKALKTGAVDAVAIDARNLFVDLFVLPALMAGAIYEGKYPLATALGRPLIAKLMVDAAHEHNAVAVAHGCTGKGNDQVRFDVTFQTLRARSEDHRPGARMEMDARRGTEISPTSTTSRSRRRRRTLTASTRTSWAAVARRACWKTRGKSRRRQPYAWTTDPIAAPNEPAYVEIEWEHGRPIGLNGQKMDGVPLIAALNELGGKHGVGRIDHVENRLVGIKSRELYEAPAAMILHEAHRELESLCLSKPSARFKTLVSQEYADIIYNGLWFSAFQFELFQFVLQQSAIRHGTARVKLYKGKATVVGRKSEYSLYSKKLATYETGDQFDHDAAKGFIRLHGLAQQTQARLQLLKDGRGFDLPALPHE